MVDESLSSTLVPLSAHQDLDLMQRLMTRSFYWALQQLTQSAMQKNTLAYPPTPSGRIAVKADQHNQDLSINYHDYLHRYRLSNQQWHSIECWSARAEQSYWAGPNRRLNCIDPLSQVASHGDVYIHSQEETWADKLLTDETTNLYIPHTTYTNILKPVHAEWKPQINGSCFVLCCVTVCRLQSTTRGSDEETSCYPGGSQGND